MQHSIRMFFFFLIFFWIILSFFNLFYNIIKTPAEIKEWVLLSDSQKRYKSLGDPYSFCMLINTNINEKNEILLYSNDGMIYFLCRYYSYPRKIIYMDDEKNFYENLKKGNYAYVAIYNLSLNPKGYKKISSLSGNSENVGNIYKKK